MIPRTGPGFRYVEPQPRQTKQNVRPYYGLTDIIACFGMKLAGSLFAGVTDFFSNVVILTTLVIGVGTCHTTT